MIHLQKKSNYKFTLTTPQLYFPSKVILPITKIDILDLSSTLKPPTYTLNPSHLLAN